ASARRHRRTRTGGAAGGHGLPARHGAPRRAGGSREVGGTDVIVLVLVETVLLAVLTVLVAGLLRAHGAVLRRLHQLDGGAQPPDRAPPFRLTAAPRPAAPPQQQFAVAHDVSGESLDGE